MSRVVRALSEMRVAVIGAGAAGLAALRHLSAKPDIFQPVAFEQTSNVAGTWVYTEQTGRDDRDLPIHASMYKNLRTNLPKEVMAFPDFPFSKNLPSFVKHEDVRHYLEDYCSHFNLQQYIQFNTLVERIHPVIGPQGTEWQVTVRNTGDASQTTQRTFDAVMVGNGHYTKPLVPHISGIETFKGQIIHSHDYRHPEDFQDKTVLCLGAGASGQDIILDLAAHAKQVYLSHRKSPLKSVFPRNIQQVAGTIEVKAKSVILEDETELEIDVLLYTTGYHFTFPFFTPECNVSTTDERVTPLYKHLMHTEHTTLALLGLCKTICPFPQFDCQVQFFLSALEGSMVLPTKEEMNEDTQKDYEWRLSQGYPPRHAHHMGPLQWPYNDDLAELAGFPRIPRIIRTLYDYVHEVRVVDLPGYKNMNFDTSGEEFRVI